MEEIIYFELNNWMPDSFYPDAEPFKTWIDDECNDKLYFISRRWCKENKLVVSYGPVDMSLNFCIAASKSWVEENCPELLTKYTKFLRPDKLSTFGMPFKEYCPENFGVHCCDLNRDTKEWEFLTEDDIKPGWFEDRDKEIYGE